MTGAPRAWVRRRAVAAAAVAAAVVVGGCGSSDPVGRPPGGEALVEYARCLRARGIDAPDPDPDRHPGGVGAVAVPTARTPHEQEAIDACARLLPAGGAEDGGGREGPSAEDLLAFARCMRAHGVDQPDPVVRADGSIDLTTPPDPSAPDLARAEQACGHLGGLRVVPGGGASISGSRRG